MRMDFAASSGVPVGSVSGDEEAILVDENGMNGSSEHQIQKNEQSFPLRLKVLNRKTVGLSGLDEPESRAGGADSRLSDHSSRELDHCFAVLY